MILNWKSLINVVSHFLVVVFKIGTPFSNFFKKSLDIFLFTVTTYSFSCLYLDLKILFTMSPSLVNRINPSLNLSNLPIGNILLL